MGEEIMEYIDRQQDITLTNEDFKGANDLREYMYGKLNYLKTGKIWTYNATSLYINGLRVETFLQPEYKDLPIEWVIKLFY